MCRVGSSLFAGPLCVTLLTASVEAVSPHLQRLWAEAWALLFKVLPCINCGGSGAGPATCAPVQPQVQMIST